MAPPAKRAMQVNVVVRVRPSLPHEKQLPVALRVAKAGQHARGKGALLTMAPPTGDAADVSEFLFDKCYDEATPQRLLFQREIQPAIAKVLEGINTTVFAYGATGTGKTFTMEGNKRNLGMIPRAVKRLFEVADETKRSFTIELSYLEIYNDRVLDLLVPKSQQTDLPIRQQPDGTIAVQGLSKKRIASVKEFEELYEKGSANRARAATDLNPESSRSHSILMIQTRTNDARGGEIKFGKLHLIDLAGSEDNRRTGNSGARLTESGKINMSLFVLGKVITALNSGDIQRIPFRDSKLTRLLQDSLGGSSHAVMICNVAQTAGLYQECLATLNYAAKAKGIVNQVVINTPAPSAKKTVKTAAKTAPSGVVKTVTTKTPVVTKPSVVTKAIKPQQPVSRLQQPATGVSKKPVSARSAKSLSPDPMESRLSAWKQTKQEGRTSLEKRNSADGTTPSIGFKRPAPTSTAPSSTAPRPVSRMSIANPPLRVLSSDPGASRVAVKKPRMSMMPTTSTQNAASRMSVCPNPTSRRAGSPSADKENMSSNVKKPVVSPVTLVKDLSPVDLAKKLIGVAIDLEKMKHFTAAYCVFKRAYHVLPEENPKLVERLHALEAECPSAPAAVPSQEMSTAVYMQLVLEMNLLEVLNNGSQDELTKLHSIGDKRAEKIIESRPFAQLSDLLQVPGITDKLLQKLHDHHIQW